VTRRNINDLLAFLAVAREGSFTRAAAGFGSQSALSHTIRQLEARLGIHLLTRTTRSVAPTEAGERLLERIGPHFDQIEVEIDAPGELRDKPAGTIRINAPDCAISSILRPKLRLFMAGVRMGEQLAKDMVIARIGPDFHFAVVGSPSYFKGRLQRVLEGWSPCWDGYHLYSPNRRQSSPAFITFVEAIRHSD